MRSRNLTAALILWGALPLFAAKSFVFTVPADALKSWTDDVVVTVPAELAGHSGVHQVQKDCEMHFGGTVKGYKGTPDGWVFEPMNVCVQPFFGTAKQKNADWLNFGEGLVG